MRDVPTLSRVLTRSQRPPPGAPLLRKVFQPGFSSVHPYGHAIIQVWRFELHSSYTELHYIKISEAPRLMAYGPSFYLRKLRKEYLNTGIENNMGIKFSEHYKIPVSDYRLVLSYIGEHWHTRSRSSQ